MDSKMMKSRTKKFAIDVLKLCASLPKTSEFRALRNQLVRSGTSPGANYRAACRAKSTADFINKMKIVEEETDESQYWLELIVAMDESYRKQVTPLWKEADQILAMVVTSIKRSRDKLKQEKNRKLKDDKDKNKDREK